MYHHLYFPAVIIHWLWWHWWLGDNCNVDDDEDDGDDYVDDDECDDDNDDNDDDYDETLTAVEFQSCLLNTTPSFTVSFWLWLVVRIMIIMMNDDDDGIFPDNDNDYAEHNATLHSVCGWSAGFWSNKYNEDHCDDDNNVSLLTTTVDYFDHNVVLIVIIQIISGTGNLDHNVMISNDDDLFQGW